jgi:hypothetical protein
LEAEMRSLARGAKVTSEYLTGIFQRMYQKVNEVDRVKASTGQYLIEGTQDGDSFIMEPMAVESSQYFDRSSISTIRDSRNLRDKDDSYSFLAKYEEDINNIRNL